MLWMVADGGVIQMWSSIWVYSTARFVCTTTVKTIIEKKENGRQIQQKNIPSVIIFYANVSNSFEQQPRQYVW